MLKGSGVFPPNTGHYLSLGGCRRKAPECKGENEVTGAERPEDHRPRTIRQVEGVDQVGFLDCQEEHESMASEYVKEWVDGWRSAGVDDQGSGKDER